MRTSGVAPRLLGTQRHSCCLGRRAPRTAGVGEGKGASEGGSTLIVHRNRLPAEALEQSLAPVRKPPLCENLTVAPLKPQGTGLRVQDPEFLPSPCAVPQSCERGVSHFLSHVLTMSKLSPNSRPDRALGIFILALPECMTGHPKLGVSRCSPSGHPQAPRPLGP